MIASRLKAIRPVAAAVSGRPSVAAAVSGRPCVAAAVSGRPSVAAAVSGRPCVGAAVSGRPQAGGHGGPPLRGAISAIGCFLLACTAPAAPELALSPAPAEPARSDRASARERPYAAGSFAIAGDDEGEIEASLYSLPSAFFTSDEVAALLSAVRRAVPRRALLVLADPAMRQALAARLAGPGVRWLDIHGRRLTPWPRDPLLFARRPDGAVLLLSSPNLQPEREQDSAMARILVGELPEDLDRQWRQATWTTAPVPFHNGQVLLAGGAAWVSLHSLEPRILELMRLPRVPVESFREAAGIDRYLAAARRAAVELEGLYGRPVRFVHPLPESGPLADRVATMQRLGGGAGFDLDSLVTLVPASGGPQALVADLDLGRRILAASTAAELDEFARLFELSTAGDALRPRLDGAQAGPRARRLQSFLDMVAGHLAAEEATVRRLPHLLVPLKLLADRGVMDHADFQITWNNTVLERTAAGLRAEGFASGLAAGDAEARRAFEAAGSRLDLLPPLPSSIVLQGGYRCASNHLRRAPR